MKHPLLTDEKCFDIKTAINGGFTIEVYKTGYPRRSIIANNIDELIKHLKDYYPPKNIDISGIKEYE